jgi:3D (Asp-Asp-Asp) domain-containing protein
MSERAATSGAALRRATVALVLAGAGACAGPSARVPPAAAPPAAPRTLEVTATAYTSSPQETVGDPYQAAWGDRLRPGMRALAVSPDLVEAGLDRGTRVRIEGVEGEWQVLDTTASRFRRRIDLYMGTDRDAALTWGKRKVRISWEP